MQTLDGYILQPYKSQISKININIILFFHLDVNLQIKSMYLSGGGTVFLWLECSTPSQAVWVRAMARALVFLGKTLYSRSASLQPGV